MRFLVEYEDGRAEEVRVIPSARRAFETEHDQSLIDAMQSGRSEWADFVVWKTLSLRKKESRDIDEWLLTVDSLKLELEADPTGDEATATPDVSSTPPKQPKSSKQ